VLTTQMLSLYKTRLGGRLTLIGAFIGGPGFVWWRLQESSKIALAMVIGGAILTGAGFLLNHFSKPHDEPLDWQMFPLSALPRNKQEAAVAIVVLLIAFMVIGAILWTKIA